MGRDGFVGDALMASAPTPAELEMLEFRRKVDHDIARHDAEDG